MLSPARGSWDDCTNLLQNLIPVILLRPLLFIVPDTTANQIRIMLLKATHAPFLGAIWVFEKWEVLALAREEEERAAMGLDLDVVDNTTTGSTNQPTPLKSKTNTSSSKKHSLTKTGKVKIPAALLAQASKRPSKKVGASHDTNGRVKTTSTTVTAGTNGSPVDAPPPPPGPAPAPTPAPGAEVGAGQAAQAVGSADVGEMMRLLKELSVQVEEVRSALVKHDNGPTE